MAQEYVASGFLLQKCQIGDVSNDDRAESLLVALQGQNHIVYGKINVATIVRHEFCYLST